MIIAIEIALSIKKNLNNLKLGHFHTEMGSTLGQCIVFHLYDICYILIPRYEWIGYLNMARVKLIRVKRVFRLSLGQFSPHL